MSDNKPTSPAPVNVNMSKTSSTEFAEAALVVCVFVTVWLCAGDPDLLDALISCLLRA